MLDHLSLKLTSEREINLDTFFAGLDPTVDSSAAKKEAPTSVSSADRVHTFFWLSGMPKTRTTRLSAPPHTHVGCHLCTDFSGMCDLHPECKECVALGMKDAFTLANLNREVKKAEDVAAYERTKATDFQNIVKRQAVTLAEKETEIQRLLNVQKGFERQLRKDAVLLDRARETYSVQCAETARWKQHVLDLKNQLSSQSQEIAAIVRDQQLLDATQQRILADTLNDPARDLLTFFTSVANEYEASV